MSVDRWGREGEWEGGCCSIWGRGSGGQEEAALREEVAEGMGCHWCTSDKGGGRGSANGKETKREGGPGAGQRWREHRAEGGGSGQLDRGRPVRPEGGRIARHTKKQAAMAEPRERAWCAWGRGASQRAGCGAVGPQR